MKTKLELSKLLNRYLIVVVGEEHKVVYSVDDSRIFSVHITGCGRGARNAVLSKDTFFTSLKKAIKSCDYMNSLNLNYKFMVIQFGELEIISKKGSNYLIEDIASFNFEVGAKNRYEKDKIKKEKQEYKKLLNEAILLLKSNYILSVDYDSDEIVITLSRQFYQKHVAQHKKNCCVIKKELVTLH